MLSLYDVLSLVGVRVLCVDECAVYRLNGDYDKSVFRNTQSNSLLFILNLGILNLRYKQGLIFSMAAIFKIIKDPFKVFNLEFS